MEAILASWTPAVDGFRPCARAVKRGFFVVHFLQCAAGKITWQSSRPQVAAYAPRDAREERSAFPRRKHIARAPRPRL